MAVVQQKIMVNIRPSMIKWAIETSGWETGELAKKMRVKDNIIEDWKSGCLEIKSTQLEKLAKCLKMPSALFFLDTPPKEPKLQDYRKLQNNQVTKLTHNTITEIRRARYLQSIAEELMDMQGINPKPAMNANVDIQTLSENAAKKERERLGFESNSVLSNKTKNSTCNFYKTLRRSIESLNILTFQTSVPINEMRGLTLSDRFPLAIIINSKDIPEARAFTLLHEYGHILLKTSGICTPQKSYGTHSNSSLGQVEKWCNGFAASVLMPKIEFLEEYARCEKKHMKVYEIINKLSVKFQTSLQATAFRIINLRDDSKISDECFRIMDAPMRQWRNVSRTVGKSGVRDRCVDQKGLKFIKLVLNAKKAKLINNKNIMDYLGMDLKYLKDLEKML